MITLIQQKNRLIGSLDDIQALSCKKSARVLVISDTHGNYKTFKRIITEFGKSCDGLILCGDCYADITALILEARADSNLQALIPSVIAFVQGNGDPSRYPMGFTIKADCKEEEKEFDFSKSLYFPQKQILFQVFPQVSPPEKPFSFLATPLSLAFQLKSAVQVQTVFP